MSDLTPELAREMVRQRIREDPSISARQPRLVHSGTYALYETPDGGRHLVYRLERGTFGGDHIVDVEGAEDQHLPDIPPAALPLIENFLANGLPPAVLAMLSGKLSPMAVMKAMRNGAGDGAG